MNSSTFEYFIDTGIIQKRKRLQTTIKNLIGNYPYYAYLKHCIHQDRYAPALATYSLLPILRAFTSSSGIGYELKDISLAGRILAHFPDSLPAEKNSRCTCRTWSTSNNGRSQYSKTPNISASIPQLQDAVNELQQKGFDVPDFPTDPETDEEKEIRSMICQDLGSAVNPVLLEGNSDRRVAKPVKEYAQNPHSMGVWTSGSSLSLS